LYILHLPTSTEPLKKFEDSVEVLKKRERRNKMKDAIIGFALIVASHVGSHLVHYIFG